MESVPFVLLLLVPQNPLSLKMVEVGGEIETLLRSMNFSLHYMGFSVLPTILSTEIQNKSYTYMSPDQFKLHLKESLKNWSEHLMNIDKIKPLSFSCWDDWDEAGNEKKHNEQG